MNTKEEINMWLKEVQPILSKNLVCVGYISNKEILVKDKYGILKTSKSNLGKGHHPNIISAINKTEYFKNELLDIRPSSSEILIIEYINNRKIRVNNGIGECICTAGSLRKFNPTIRSAIDKSTYFASQSMEIHGDSRFDYKDVEYVDEKTKVVISCLEHGPFSITPDLHKHSGGGCPGCSKNSTEPYPSLAKKFPHMKGVDLYLMELCGEGEETFYKIGLSKDIYRRERQIPYRTNILKLVEGPLGGNFLTEQFISNMMEKLGNTYVPEKKFGGYTECFKCERWIIDKMIELM